MTSPPRRSPPRGLEPWRQEAGAVARAMGVDPRQGLSAEEAAARLARSGRNELDGREPNQGWALLARQFTNTMTVVLAVAATITAVIGDRTDTVVIAAIVVLNGMVGFVQEYRAERALEVLRSMAADAATVVRDGTEIAVDSALLVPGDVVRLAAGDIMPADLRLVDVQALRVNEATLTGESEAALKQSDALPDVDGALVGDRTNMGFKGTAVTYGRGVGVVVATGMATELGQVAELLRSHGEAPTPLQRRLTVLARRMAAAAGVVCTAVFVVGVARGEPVERMFLTAVSLAVAAIPEGLPAVITVALALGARRMSARHAVVRKLAAVETLGSVSVICTDKTGTLTENRMVAERVWTPDGEYEVSGVGYEPAGTLVAVGGSSGADRYLRRLATAAAAANDAVLHAPDTEGGEWWLTGDATEGALLALAGKLAVDATRLRVELPRVAEVAFDAGRRRMTTVHRDAGGFLTATKGALEAVEPLLVADDHDRVRRAAEVAVRWGGAGLRVMAVADRRTDALPHTADTENDLHLVGLIGITDPPRPAAAPSIAECRAAGITPIMISGDHASTAAAIARRLGILDDDDGGEVMTGAELDRLDDATLAVRIGRISVFARTDPAQKLRIVEAWKERGAVVAMTGDGVNDAPALRRADIGVAMGLTGTDVSKEAADMVLTDDDFGTIVHAVEEGRRIYDNIRRFVRYLLATNLGEVAVMFMAPLLGLPIPLLPVQILWVNLVTDGAPAIALGLEPAEPDSMRRPPRPSGESILAGGLWQHALWVGALMAATVILMQLVARQAGWPWRTMVFTTLALLQLGHAVAVRSETRSALRVRSRGNPWLVGVVAATVLVQLALVYVPVFHDVFKTTSLTAPQLGVVAVASPMAFVGVEIEKWIRRSRAGTRPARASAGVRGVPTVGS